MSAWLVVRFDPDTGLLELRHEDTGETDSVPYDSVRRVALESGAKS